jgi:hypothetical protein
MQQLQADCRLDLDTPLEKADERLSTKHLYTEIGGEMLGVLVCEDAIGNEVILRAFSSTHNGVWNVSGWVPHIANEEKYMKIVNEGNREIHPLTELLPTLKKGSTQWLEKTLERKLISQKVLAKLYALYEITNFKNEKRTLSDAFNIKKGIPNGTGDCCAPKLLNHAAKNNLKPISIAEFFGEKDRDQKLKESFIHPAPINASLFWDLCFADPLKIKNSPIKNPPF